MKRGIGTVSKKEIVVSDVEKEHDNPIAELVQVCLLYTSDAADE